MGKTIKVSKEVYDTLLKTKDKGCHNSMDSVLRKLLGLKPFEKRKASPTELQHNHLRGEDRNE